MARLRRLWLRAFRNYERADLEVAPGVTALVGPNGAGKSNLLEAVYLVATGRSHRTVREAEAIRNGETAARVRAQVARRGRDEELEITLSLDAARLITEMRVNGATTPRSGVLGRLPVVLATPWDLEVVRGASASRRRLLDGALAQLSPAYFFALHRYHRVVQQRNAELRRGAPGGLEPWDAQLVALGARITSHRAGFAARLGPEATRWCERLGGIGALGVHYRPAWAGGTDEERLDAARAQLGRWRADEYRRGATLTGPHRDDLDLTLDGAPLRAVGSRGQWRLAMLALRLAERSLMAAEMGEMPLLLLDDALAELDPRRARRVLEMDPGDAQVLLTATSPPASTRPLSLWHVEAGAVKPVAWSPRFATS